MTTTRLTRLTEAQYQEALRYSSQMDKTLEQVYAALVQGIPVAQIALSHGVTRASVYQRIDTFLHKGTPNHDCYPLDVVEAVVQDHTRDPLVKDIAKMYLVNGYSCKYIARLLNIPAGKVHDKAGRILDLIKAPENAKPAKSKRQELPRISFALHDWRRFLSKVSGLSESTLAMAEKYHLQGMTRHQIAKAMNRRPSDVYRNLETFAKRHAAFLKEEAVARPYPVSKATSLFG